MDAESCDFSAEICKIGVNPYVDVPGNISIFFGKRGYIPVKGTLNDVAIHATLVPVGNGRHRLYINGEMRKKANVDVGDKIQLTLTLDTEPRKAPIPEGFAEALQKNTKALAAFERLPPSHQKEILDYLNYLKKPESLKRNIAKILRKLVEQ